MTTTQETEAADLRAQLATMPNEVAQVKAAIRAIAAGQRVQLEDFTAARIITRAGYAEFSDTKHMLILTEKGKRFHKLMKRFG